MVGRWEPRPGPFSVAASTRISFRPCLRLPLAAVLAAGGSEEARVLEEAHDSGEVIQRVAALDIGKAQLVCCVRVPGEGERARRLQDVKADPTMTRSLLVLADRLRQLGVTRVVMEATRSSRSRRTRNGSGRCSPTCCRSLPPISRSASSRR